MRHWASLHVFINPLGCTLVDEILKVSSLQGGAFLSQDYGKYPLWELSRGCGRKRPPKKKASVAQGTSAPPGGGRWRHGRAVSAGRALGASRSAFLPGIAEERHFPSLGFGFLIWGISVVCKCFINHQNCFHFQVKAHSPAKAEESGAGRRWWGECQAHPLI